MNDLTTINMEMLSWLQEWYASQCDGEWEHEYGVRIDTLDNPGWSIKIDLAYTNLENIEIQWTLQENNEIDWYGFSIKNKIYEASGDPSKLEYLIGKFKSLIEEYDTLSEKNFRKEED